VDCDSVFLSLASAIRRPDCGGPAGAGASRSA
jgi:hypothetical protein